MRRIVSASSRRSADLVVQLRRLRLGRLRAARSAPRAGRSAARKPGGRWCLPCGALCFDPNAIRSVSMSRVDRENGRQETSRFWRLSDSPHLPLSHSPTLVSMRLLCLRCRFRGRLLRRWRLRWVVKDLLRFDLHHDVFHVGRAVLSAPWPSSAARSAANSGVMFLSNTVSGCGFELQVALQQLVRRVRRERRLAGEELVQHAAEAVDVGARRRPAWPRICSGDM